MLAGLVGYCKSDEIADLLPMDDDCCYYTEAGTWNDNFSANPNDIVRPSGGVVTDLRRG